MCLSSLVSARRTTWPNGEWGYSTRGHMLEPVRPEAVLPDRALCLPTFSHLLIVNKTSLSLSLSLFMQGRESCWACMLTVMLSDLLYKRPLAWDTSFALV